MKRHPIITVRDLWFSYNGNLVLKAVNLSVYKGDFLAVIGPNGGGKTTLLKLMLGLLEPQKGTVHVFGRPPREVAPRIGYVPQAIGINRRFPISVQDVVLMGRLIGGGGFKPFSKEDRRFCDRVLAEMGIENLRNRRIGELSGGQRQRVLAARALVSEPEILFLDEPTASVDTRGQTEFYTFLKELNEKVTIIVVSHDVMVLSSYVRSVACVNQQLFFHDAPEITYDMLEMAYHCPVELITHGRLPHRVIHKHEEDDDAGGA